MTDVNNSGISTLAGKKVLIIEDDVFLGGILFRHMVDDKIDVRLITTGENAIENIKKDIPSILILDILLPGSNGLDILE
ncbi:response regulator, partial [Staphylococcus aureus]|uniref:response regulator n=1 Tax=Staphylococcus aureus TaxID=1280 RepID=UPI0039BDCEA3